jgi:NAD(P)-dependent dehydrogenase (short-subunit alcohol dehydrogenase family)
LQKKIALVTGSSSGIGYETALLLARNGFHTCATMRNTEKSESLRKIAEKEKLPIRFVQLDVDDDESVDRAIGEIEKELGKIDVLINNAGYGLVGGFEDLAPDEIRQQFETNLFGVIRVIQRVLPGMRTRRNGIIVNISSGAGIVGFPCMSGYVSTKFALEGLSESIAHELLPFGIKVIIIEPGVIKTDFVRNSVTAKRALNESSAYFDILGKIRENLILMQEHATSPTDVAKIIFDAINHREPNLRYVVGNDIAMVAEAKRNLPEAEFRKMMIQDILRDLSRDN